MTNDLCPIKCDHENCCFRCEYFINATTVDDGHIIMCVHDDSNITISTVDSNILSAHAGKCSSFKSRVNKLEFTGLSLVELKELAANINAMIKTRLHEQNAPALADKECTRESSNVLH